MRSIHLGIALLVGAGFTWPALADPNPAPRKLTIWVVGGEARLSWLPPQGGSGNTQVKVVRRLNAPPSGPEDLSAEVLFAGVGTQLVDPIGDLLPDLAGAPHVYHYAVFGCDALGTCETTGSHASLAPTLVQCLRGGGYTIFWRHADADVCADNTSLGTAANPTIPNWWRSCDANCATATARQLNAAGVERATFIGQQTDALGIDVGRVISSEFCRCIQTAELMDFGPTIETDTGISFFVYDESNRCTHCYDRIYEVPAPGTNTAIIGHAGFSPSCATLGALAWSECALFKPDGAGGATFITRLTWDAWGLLATDVAPVPLAPGSATLDAAWETADGVRVRYRIEGDAVPVRLEIFDIRGRLLWSMREQSKRQGEHEQLWDRRDEHGHGVGRGVYLVRMHAGPTTSSRKALVLRP